MPRTVDITVVGAGLIGASLALMLAKQGKYSVRLLESQTVLTPSKDTNQRVVALGKPATQCLKEVGVVDSLEDEAFYPYTAMQVWDQNSNGCLRFTAQELGLNELGFMVDAVECTRQLQLAANHHSDLQCLFEADLHDLSETGSHITLTTSDGELRTRLLVACDGANSWVRRRLHIFSNKHDYQQLGIVAKIRSSLSHQDTAWQRFLSTGPVAVLPLSQNQSSIVWSADSGLAESLMSMSEHDFNLALAEALENRLGQIELLSVRKAFPLMSQHATNYFKGATVLVGDAAHSIHPLAGQGANLGFKDLRALAALLEQGSDPADPKLLERYQRQRQADNIQTDALMSALHAAYRPDQAVWSSVRGLGMNLLNSQRLLRGILARLAIG